MGVMGGMFLMGSTATLDTGKHNTNWHVFNAGNFFAWSIFSCWYYTFLSWILYKKAGAVSSSNAYLKVFMSFLIVFQIILDIQAGIHDIKPLSNTLEYTIAFSILAFFLIYRHDLKDFSLVYHSKGY